jgi:N-acetylneuraminic acid mutarotase
MGAVRYEKRFFLIGGENLEGSLQSVLIFDIENEIWSHGADLPFAISEVNATLVGEKIYVPGGRLEDNTFSDKLLVYDPRDDNWDTKADLPVALSAYAMVPYEGKIYLFGGWDGNEYLDEVWVYDPGLDKWQSFGQLPEERGFATAEVVGGVIHLLGGMNDKHVLANHDLFYPQRQLENENAWEVASKLPQARYGMESSVLADMIYIAGGKNENSSELPLIQYLPPKETWMDLDQPPLSVGAFPSVLPYETKLYIMGGETAVGVQVTMQSYQAVYTVLVPVIRQ